MSGYLRSYFNMSDDLTYQLVCCVMLLPEFEGYLRQQIMADPPRALTIASDIARLFYPILTHHRHFALAAHSSTATSTLPPLSSSSSSSII
jgi:hypothetical protein